MISAHKKTLFLLLLAGLITLTLCGVSKEGDASSPIKPDECCRCHFDTCNDSKAKPYVHSPVRENFCSKCHIKQVISTRKDTRATNTSNIKWFRKIYTLADEHWFELPPGSENRLLSVETRNNNRTKLTREVIIPSLAQIAPFPTPLGDTTLSKVTIREVKQGVFISANITWHTDRICDTKLMYGQNNIQSNTDSDPRWTRRHAITITGLEKKKTYMLAAASEDVFGNEIVSPPITLSTHKFFKAPPSEVPPPTDKIEITHQFFKKKERIFVSFTSNQQVTMRLGFRKTANKQTTGDDVALPGKHLPLTEPFELTITVCLTCHPESKGKLSHPVDVKPKSGMTIPGDYPTLADGRLTCMSCHKPHAASNHFRLIRKKRKDLCLGCHRNF